MEVIIHRGTHQIGGCATEYRTKNARIFIDFGAELDSENAKPFDIEGVTKGKTNCDAVFFTHYHGDHMGLLDSINVEIPLYMGEASKAIAKILNDRLSKSQKIKSYDVERIESIKIFTPAKTLTIGDIKITPYSVDHSAYDAYMFVIEADGKKVLHTGDFRTHGFRGKGVRAVLEKYVGKVDALVCEGTTLNRDTIKCETEYELTNRIKKVIEENKYVFVLCSSTNIDRLAGVCSAVPKGRYCVCDKYQMSVIDYIKEYGGKHSDLYKFDKALWYGENLDEKMEKFGFCMFVRSGNTDHKQTMEKFKHLNPVVIYSMWKGYLEDAKMQDFLDGYKRIDLHTSGHADSDAIKMVVDVTNPDMVLPMHTEVPEAFLKLVGDSKVVLAKDGEIINLEEKKMGRTISDTFVRDLESGVLSKLTKAVKENKKLIMCFRNDYINVYYKSHSVFKIEEQKTQYKITFNLGHARYLSDFRTVQNELKEFNIDAKVSISKDKNGKDKYSYSAVFLVRKNVSKYFEFSPIIDLYTCYIDDFFTGGLRKDKFEGIERKTNSLREKRHQQCLYSKHLDSTKEILFYDMELSLPRPKDDSDEMKLIIDETDAKKHITGAPDCLAVRMKNGTVSKIVLVEVKSTWDACTGEHGIEKHGRDFGDIIKCSYYRNFIAESMRETLDLYARYGLCDKINIPDEFGEKKEDFEVLYFFTHEDVIRWTKESKEDSKNNKKKYNELYSQNPQMFIDYSYTMKELLGKDYD